MPLEQPRTAAGDERTAAVFCVDLLSLGAGACGVVYVGMLTVSVIQSFLSFLVMVSFSSESFHGVSTVR